MYTMGSCSVFLHALFLDEIRARDEENMTRDGREPNNCGSICHNTPYSAHPGWNGSTKDVIESSKRWNHNKSLASHSISRIPAFPHSRILAFLHSSPPSHCMCPASNAGWASLFSTARKHECNNTGTISKNNIAQTRRDFLSA
jgi:hypothetical protein